ncbi:MAG: hypothetical protein M3N33_00495, partial [Actinomycetota bacterium]|nr:hypothetical protein [Actinomycetota bacterium]
MPETQKASAEAMTGAVERAEAGRLAEEAEVLSGRLEAARRQAADVGKRLEQAERRQREIAPAVFSDEAEAREELDGLEEEAEALARSRRVASSAAEGFAAELEGVRGRLRAASEEVHRARARALEGER